MKFGWLWMAGVGHFLRMPLMGGRHVCDCSSKNHARRGRMIVKGDDGQICEQACFIPLGTALLAEDLIKQVSSRSFMAAIPWKPLRYWY